MTATLLAVWRYPVKSLQGERLDEAGIGPRGVDGDRRYAIFDLRTGLGLTARRDPALLFAFARLMPDGGVEIQLPDGSLAADDEALSAWLGRPVALRSAAEQAGGRYESPLDFEAEARSEWEVYDGARVSFHDSDDAPVSLLSATALGGWDPRRFRANLVLDGIDEAALVDSQVTIGGAVLDVGDPLMRCVMTTRPQPGGIERNLDVLRRIHRERDGCLAVGATVARAGTVRVGEPVSRSWPSPAIRRGGAP